MAEGTLKGGQLSQEHRRWRTRLNASWRHRRFQGLVMTLIALLMVVSQAAAATAGLKPDFSAQWVVNASESDFGLIPPPQCRGLKVSHREPELVAEETGPGGEPCGLTIRYSTDGTPVTYTANNARQRAQLTWSGNALVITRTSDDGVAMRIEATLSADGRKLTRAFYVESPQGSTSWTYVYDRAAK